MHPSLITTCDSIPGYRVAKVISVVAELAMNSSAQAAIMRIVNQAGSMNANAIIGLHFAILSAQPGLFSVLAYGTAVWVEYV